MGPLRGSCACYMIFKSRSAVYWLGWHWSKPFCWPLGILDQSLHALLAAGSWLHPKASLSIFLVSKWNIKISPKVCISLLPGTQKLMGFWAPEAQFLKFCFPVQRLTWLSEESQTANLLHSLQKEITSVLLVLFICDSELGRANKHRAWKAGSRLYLCIPLQLQLYRWSHSLSHPGLPPFFTSCCQGSFFSCCQHNCGIISSSLV